MDDIFIDIRPARPGDVLQLQQLSIITFTDTYGVYNTPANMQLFIEERYTVQQLLQELNNTRMQFFMAYNGNEPVGYIKLRTEEEPAELAGRRHIEIERIYVLPAFKGMKIGKKLIDYAAAIAQQQQYEVIWLGVWEENKSAQAFYTKQGFTIFGEHPFLLGADAQKDWLMKRELV
ncbi:MAG TPA: GNAT family N-acetyltransferase [Chitinophagaceae bacterium]|nr:GNAT family N-acetyltransferase [Chitinophagaceae bacterium]